MQESQERRENDHCIIGNAKKRQKIGNEIHGQDSVEQPAEEQSFRGKGSTTVKYGFSEDAKLLYERKSAHIFYASPEPFNSAGSIMST
jgi:hypothetical protein